MRVTSQTIPQPQPPREYTIVLNEIEASAVLAAVKHPGGQARVEVLARLQSLLQTAGVTSVFTNRERGLCYLDRP